MGKSKGSGSGDTKDGGRGKAVAPGFVDTQFFFVRNPGQAPEEVGRTQLPLLHGLKHIYILLPRKQAWTFYPDNPGIGREDVLDVYHDIETGETHQRVTCRAISSTVRDEMDVVLTALHSKEKPEEESKEEDHE